MALRDLLERYRGYLGSLVALWGCLGGLLEQYLGEEPQTSFRLPSLGLSWGPVGALLSYLGGPWMDCFGVILEALRAVSDAVKTKEASVLKTYVFRRL